MIKPVNPMERKATSFTLSVMFPSIISESLREYALPSTMTSPDVANMSKGLSPVFSMRAVNWIGADDCTLPGGSNSSRMPLEGWPQDAVRRRSAISGDQPRYVFCCLFQIHSGVTSVVLHSFRMAGTAGWYRRVAKALA